jgi:nucleoside-diphosphate kinase
MSALFEKTFVLLKPDAIERGLMLPLLGELSFSPVKARLFTPFRDIWGFHYNEHKGKDFYERLVAHMSSGQVFAMIVGGVDAVHLARERALALRAKYGTVGPRNLIHTSDSPESARYEVNLWEPNL